MTNEVISDVSILITPFCSNFVTEAGNEATMDDFAIWEGSWVCVCIVGSGEGAVRGGVGEWWEAKK